MQEKMTRSESMKMTRSESISGHRLIFLFLYKHVLSSRDVVKVSKNIPSGP